MAQLPSFPFEESKLIAFVRAGGGLYISGERNPCTGCKARTSVQNILANLLLKNVEVGTSHTDGVDFVPGASPPFGLTATPNVLTSFTAILSSFLGKVPSDRVVFETAAHDVGAAAFGPEDLGNAGGCLYVNMDLAFLNSESIAPTYPLQTALLARRHRAAARRRGAYLSRG